MNKRFLAARGIFEPKSVGLFILFNVTINKIANNSILHKLFIDDSHSREQHRHLPANYERYI